MIRRHSVTSANHPLARPRQKIIHLPALLVLLVLAVSLAPRAAVAATAGDKALRGLANMVAGVMAFPGEIHKTWNEEGAAMGLTVGFAKGIGMIPVRELMGVFELLTSPAPWPDAHFNPILKPEYPWGYFEK